MKRFFSFLLALMMLSCSVGLAENSRTTSAPKGVNIAEWIKRYYQRKATISEMVGIDMEYGVMDSLYNGMAYIDGVGLFVTDDTVSQFTIQESELSDLVRAIPAIYALNSDAMDDEHSELQLSFGIMPDHYWLTSYKTDFESFRNATKENPVYWGDYEVRYYKVDGLNAGVGSFISFTLTK